MSDQIINCVHDILCRTDDLKDRLFLEEAIAELDRLRSINAELLAACQDQLQGLALNTPFVNTEEQAAMADSMDRQRERLRKVIATATTPSEKP